MKLMQMLNKNAQIVDVIFVDISVTNELDLRTHFVHMYIYLGVILNHCLRK